MHPLSEETSQLLDWFRNFLFKELGVRKELVTIDADLVKDLGADSLDQVSLILDLEERFKLTISDEDAVQISTVGDVITLIQQQRSQSTQIQRLSLDGVSDESS